ncbi:MAG: DUF1232 domain-containing protein [Tissierellia bacterium]|nr:DUF1232 domain-containing protein [Tissierellia bacterium]
MIIKGILRRMMPKASTLITNPRRTKKILKEGISIVRGKRQFADIQKELLTLMYMVRDAATGRYRGLSKKNMVFILAGVLYLINPADVVPDFIFSVGFFDDLAVLAYVIQHVGDELRAYKDWRREEGDLSLEDEGYQVIQQEA